MRGRSPRLIHNRKRRTTAATAFYFWSPSVKHGVIRDAISSHCVEIKPGAVIVLKENVHPGTHVHRHTNTHAQKSCVSASRRWRHHPHRSKLSCFGVTARTRQLEVKRDTSVITRGGAQNKQHERNGTKIGKISWKSYCHLFNQWAQQDVNIMLNK